MDAFIYNSIIDTTRKNSELGDVLADYLIDNVRDSQLSERLTQARQQGNLAAFQEQIKQYLQSLSGQTLMPAVASAQALAAMPRLTSQDTTMVLDSDVKFSI